MKILLVHGDELVVQRFQEVLQRQGYEISVARDGIAGLAAVDKVSPRLVVADIALARLDGITLLRALRARADTRDTPFVFLSGIADPQTMMRGLAAGAHYYVTVPIQEDDLRYKVRRLLR